jgi:hypothetical protein
MSSFEQIGEPLTEGGAKALIVATAPHKDRQGRLTAVVQLWKDTVVHEDEVRCTVAKERTRYANDAALPAQEPADTIAAALLRLGAKLGAWLDTQPAGGAQGSPRYTVQDGRICRLSDGNPIPLCNFSAAIAEELTIDDGAETRGELAIVVTLHSGKALGTARIPRPRFASLDWVIAHFGTQAIIEPGMNAKDHLRAAIQNLSTDVVRRHVYAHTGWLKREAEWCYLHAGGAIGASGPVADIEVQLGRPLAGLHLPDPPTGAGLVAAVRASLRVLDVAPDPVSVPVLAAVFRAVLCEALPSDSAIWIEGQTGTLKSELSALGQAHFGRDFTRLTLPANWESTANALERLAFEAKDTLLVIDDYAPKAGTLDAAKQQGTAERVIRGVGNHSGRGRMNADLSQRPTYWARGLVLTSGEDVLKGQSIAARLCVVGVERGTVRGKGSVQGDLLAACQTDAAAGRYAETTAGYVHWLAGRLDAFKETLPQRRRVLRDELHRDGQHLRTPDAIAGLLLAWEIFLDFATEAGAATVTEAAALLGRARAALVEVGDAQAAYSASRDPVTHFCDLLAGTLAGGRAYLTTLDGGQPDNPARFGWRQTQRTFGTAEGPEVVDEWHPAPGGRQIGYLADDDTLYLLPDLAFAIVQTLAGEKRDSLAVSEQTLWKRLKQAGLLASVDETRQRNTVRRTIGQTPAHVLHLHSRALYGRKTGQTVQTGQHETPTREGEGAKWPVLMDGFPEDHRKPAKETGHLPDDLPERAPGAWDGLAGLDGTPTYREHPVKRERVAL